MALGQKDLKKFLAYSNLGSMGFIILGVFLLNPSGIKGALLQMINHGITMGALFICAGIIYERTQISEIRINPPSWKTMPVFLVFLTILIFSTLGFPGTNGFTGEFLILLGAFEGKWYVGCFAVIGAVLTMVYMLRLFRDMVWANVSDTTSENMEMHTKMNDLSIRETVMLSFLSFFIFWIGFNPAPILNIMDESVNHLLNQFNAGLLQSIPVDSHHALFDKSLCRQQVHWKGLPEAMYEKGIKEFYRG